MIDETATAQNIARVRREFATWLAVDLAAGDLLDDLILAVYDVLDDPVRFTAGTQGGDGPVLGRAFLGVVRVIHMIAGYPVQAGSIGHLKHVG